MKTNPQKLTSVLLVALVAGLCIAGTKVSKLGSTRTIDTNSLFIVVTGATTKVTKQIPENDLMTNLMHKTHFASDGWFWITNRRVVIITNGLTGQFLTYSNGVPQWVNVTPGGGAGDVSTAQLLVVSNQANVSSNKFQTDVSNLQGATNGLATRMANAEGATNGLTTRATAVEARATNLEGATNGLSTRATNLEGSTNGLNSGVNGLLSRALTNSDTRIITLATNVTVQGRATNENSLAVHNGNIRLFGTNGTSPTVTIQDYGSGNPQILQQNANGTEASPSQVTSGDVVGQYGISGFGDTIYKTAFSIRPTATANFADSLSSTIVRFGVGDAAGSTLGRNVANWTAYSFTNDVNVNVKSNLWVGGNQTNDLFLHASAITSGGTFAGLGLSNYITGDLGTPQLTLMGTNVYGNGTNHFRWLKMIGGQSASSFAILDANTNLAGWVSTSAIPSQTQLVTASNDLYALETMRNAAVSNGLSTRIDAKVGPLETMTNGVRVRLTTNINLIAGPNIQLLATNNTSSDRTDYWIDAPSTSLSDSDKGDVTVSGAGAIWTVDNQSITPGKITNIAGFSILAKADTGSGSMGVVTAAANGALRRSGSGDMAFGTLDTGNITDDAITYAKIQNVSTTQRALGRGSAGPGDTEELTATQILDWIGSTQGGLLYRGASSWTMLSPGTAGQVLQSGGAAANPSWVSGGSGSTNPVAFAAGSIYLTNAFYFQGTNAYLGGTNMWLDGGRGILFSNVFAANAGGLTNVLATNILDGETIDYWFFPSNGVSVNFPQFADADYLEGSLSPQTNRWNLARISRRNTTTNIWLLTKAFELTSRGPNLKFTTNYAAGVITNWVNPNLTNIEALSWQTENRLIPTNNALSNIVVNFGVTNYVEVWFTNNLTFTNWTGLADDSHSASATYLLRPQLITRGVNWGNLGLSNPGYSVAIATNANNLLWTSLTNGKTYALTMTRVRTNIFPTLTLWE